MEQALKKLLAATFKTRPDTITLATGPQDIPAWDSAGHLNLVLEIERQFGLQFGDDEVVELISLEAILAALARHGITEPPAGGT